MDARRIRPVLSGEMASASLGIGHIWHNPFLALPLVALPLVGTTFPQHYLHLALHLFGLVLIWPCPHFAWALFGTGLIWHSSLLGTASLASAQVHQP